MQHLTPAQAARRAQRYSSPAPPSATADPVGSLDDARMFADLERAESALYAIDSASQTALAGIGDPAVALGNILADARAALRANNPGPGAGS